MKANLVEIADTPQNLLYALVKGKLFVEKCKFSGMFVCLKKIFLSHLTDFIIALTTPHLSGAVNHNNRAFFPKSMKFGMCVE